MPSPSNVDIAIAGGGLSGAFIACRLLEKRPDLNVVVLERGETLGGNHVWSFHQTDVSPETYKWLSPFIVHHWPRQTVRFPDYERSIETAYCSITSERLHEVMAPLLDDDLMLGTEVVKIRPNAVHLVNDTVINAKAVIDARGEARSDHLSLGFQKFVGQEIEFAQPHGVSAPVIMDAAIPQLDGYRFVYVLPFSERTALVEDTRYADGAQLDSNTIRKDIADYCRSRGWTQSHVIREEDGVLPIALAGDIDAYLDECASGVAVAGMRAALFHPLTGYSLPDAAALADLIASQSDLSGSALAKLTRAHASRVWRQRGFYRLLCRMLFTAAEPDERYKVLQRFLPAEKAVNRKILCRRTFSAR